MSDGDPHRWARFAGSLVTLVALAVAAPVGLIVASRSRFGSGNPLSGADPPWQWGSGGVGDALSGPIPDDTVIDGIVRLSLCVVWVAIAVIVVATLVEVVHAVRHHGLAMPDVRGMGWAQQIGRFVAVGLVAVLPMMSSSTSLASTLEARAVAAPPYSPPSVTSPTAMIPELRAIGRVGSVPTAPGEAAGSVHVVAPGESIHSIAVVLAGDDPARTLEIADAIIDANLGREMAGGQRFTSPAYIEVGWILQIPADFSPPGTADNEQTYTVERGDTLWDIADEELGDPNAWTEIWEHNDGDDMGEGRTFDDPDLILPGWELDLPDPLPADAEPTIEPATAPVEASPTIPPSDPVPPAAPTNPTAVSPTATSATTVPTPTTTAPSMTTTPTTTNPSTSTTIGEAAEAPGDSAGDLTPGLPAPDAPSPIRLEHAALVAAGVLALVGVRRRQRLRAARPRHRVPEPRPDVARTERRLRTIDAGERMMRVDVACRAAARSLIDTTSQIGWIDVSADGDLELRLTAPARLPMPWTGDGQSWRLGAEVPIEILGEDARQVGQPCVALVQLGVTPEGHELLVDLEAFGVLAVAARSDQADEVVTALAAALASSQFAEVAHLIGVSLPESALLGHRNAQVAGSADAALELAWSLVGSTATNERSSFELRSLRTGGEMWEPAVVLLRSDDDGAAACGPGFVPAAGRGLAVVVADERAQLTTASARLVAGSDGWRLEAFGVSIDVTPVGVKVEELAEITELIADADRDLEPADPVDEIVEPIAEPTIAAPFEPRPHEIVVGLLGGVAVHARSGEPGSFERSKTVELIAWLTTHRDRATRSGARTALWDLAVRDATFANVVSEARRALARLVPPPNGEEWVARTLTEQLPVHDLVVTDAKLVEDRLAHARLQPPSQAIETLRPAVELVRDLPFAGTSYLWPDAEGITSNFVLLAITATAEFAGHALSLGDTDGVFWATGKGLRVLPGHEELIALRMQAHARAGDLAGVRQEWESYERVLVADAWSDGEPAPKLLALRRELLHPSSS